MRKRGSADIQFAKLKCEDSMNRNENNLTPLLASSIILIVKLRERKQDMFYVLTKKTNGEAVLRKRFRTVGYAERWLAEHFPEWEEKYDLEILY